MSNLPTKREWLVARGLAKANVVGRFSKEANEALAKAVADGVQFADNQPKATRESKPKAEKVVINQPYDVKKVRVWAAKNGITLGERGRIAAEIVAKYLAANGEDATPAAPVPAPGVGREQVRPQTVAYGISRRKPEDSAHVSEPVVSISSCGRCGSGIAYCKCVNGPHVPSFLDPAMPKASLDKPAV